MFTVTVKDHIMIAHSLPDPFFGPAQNKHGATYIMEATFSSEKLNHANVVIDIGEATDLAKEVLQELNYQDLDTLPQFENILTTTEYLAFYIHGKMKARIADHLKLKIVLLESHVAAASYEA